MTSQVEFGLIPLRLCKDNPKHFWKYVKSKTKSKEPIGDLVYTHDIGDKITATTDDNKAEVLCDFFSSVFCLEKDGEFPVLNLSLIHI